VEKDERNGVAGDIEKLQGNLSIRPRDHAHPPFVRWVVTHDISDTTAGHGATSDNVDEKGYDARTEEQLSLRAFRFAHA